MNVMFKRGSQASLQKYILGTTEAVEGSFYLTSDTNRLYIGKKDENDSNKVKAFPVNQGVITVDAIASLPSADNAEAGQFYYVSGSNILCVHNGKQWVQINPDTNTYITERKSVGSTGAEENYVIITDTVTQKEESGGKIDENSKEEFVSQLAVKGEDGVNVTVTTFKDDKNKEHPLIKISQDKYEISSSVSDAGKKYTLTISDGHSTDDVALKAGNNITFSENEQTHEITVNSKDTNLDDKATGSSAKNELSFDIDGKLTSVITDSAGNYVSANVTPTIKYAPGADGVATEEAVFSNGIAALSVYSKAQIDERLRGLNAMTYMGTVGETGKYQSLPVVDDGIRVGDTFKFIDSEYVNNTKVKIGDIAIATGTEDPTTGLITSNLVWDIIPSGDDSQSDTTYWTEAIEAGVELKEADGSTEGASKGGIQIVDKDSTDAAGIATYLTIANESTIDTTTPDKNTINKVVVKHKEQEDATIKNGSGVTADDTEDASQGAGSNLDIYVPVLSYDKAGHITKVESKKYTVKDTIDQYDLEYLKITSASTNVNAGLLSATATVEASLLDKLTSDADVANFNITSSTITLSATDDGNLVMDIEWGEFN